MNKKKCYYVDHLLAFRGGTRILKILTKFKGNFLIIEKFGGAMAPTTQ